MGDAKPKVFEEGTLTIVISANGASVYTGPHELKELRAISASYDENGVSADIVFPHIGNDLKIEQETRALSGLKWLNIRKM